MQETVPEHEQSPPEEARPETEVPGTVDETPLADVFLRSPLRLAVCAAVLAAVTTVAAVRYDDVSHVFVVAVYGAILIVCAASDLATFRVPNVITYPGVLLALLISAFLPDSDLAAAVIGGAVAGTVMLLALVMSRGGMGMGDVKLSVFAGVALGWPFIAPAMVLTAVAGGIVALFLLLFRLRGRKDAIPYAPFISAGSIAVMLWQGTAFVEIS